MAIFESNIPLFHWVTTIRSPRMPIIAFDVQVRDNTVSQAEGHTTPEGVAWIVIAIVGGVIFLGAAVVLALIYRSRLRQRKKDLALRPFYIQHYAAGRRRTSAHDQFREEEERRRDMIRKSLATRSSYSAASSRASQASLATLDQVDRELSEMERQESIRLKDDWKRWEARVRHERSVSGEQHPLVGQAIAASNAVPNAVPILAIPSPAKHRSQGRMSLSPPPITPPTPPTTPPVPSRHPGRRSYAYT